MDTQSNQNTATSQPNIITAIDLAHGAASQVEEAMMAVEDKLKPILSPLKEQSGAAASGAPAPSSGLLMDYIKQLESRLYNLESRAASILNRIHL